MFIKHSDRFFIDRFKEHIPKIEWNDNKPTQNTWSTNHGHIYSDISNKNLEIIKYNLRSTNSVKEVFNVVIQNHKTKLDNFCLMFGILTTL